MLCRMILAVLLSSALLMAQPASRLRTPAAAPITAIAIVGNKTLATNVIVASTGLELKESGGQAQFDAARDRLLDTGFFDAVSYSYRQQDLGFSITFTVAETKQLFPLRVEALPISLDRVMQIVKLANPLFTGLLPATKRVLDAACAAIQRDLPNPEIRVRASVIPTGPDQYAIEFQPAEGLPVIADLTFEGAKAISATDLHVAMVQEGIGQTFSDSAVRALLDRIVRPMYEKLGYMRVTFPGIAGHPAEKVKGLDVQVTVVEGPRYKLGKLSVRGTMASDARRIIRMANLPDSEFVNYDSIAQAAPRIRDILRGEGYLDAAVSSDRSIDDKALIVDAWFDVFPGEIYTFGRLDVNGLGLDGEAAVRKLWAIKPGDPFPGGYPEHFAQVVKKDGYFDNLGAVTATPGINKQTRIVDVTLTFTGTPGTRRRSTQ